jgi:nucleoside-diphosphate-sugar epimerase
MAKLVVGCGYLGKRVAALWRAHDRDVFVVTRSSERAKEMEQSGFQPLIGDITDPTSLPRLPDVDAVLFAVGFDRTSNYSIDELYVNGLRNTLAAVGEVGRWVHISSTGVYSQNTGEWVDEASEAVPVRPGGRASLEAEQLLAASVVADRAVILRLAGIYGPDRVPNRQALLAGEPIKTPANGYLNLIHVDDAAQIVVAAVTQIVPPQLLLVSDGSPVLRRTYYETVAAILEAPAPTFAEPDPDAPATARALADKRAWNISFAIRAIARGCAVF